MHPPPGPEPRPSDATHPRERLAVFGWAVLGFNLLVILWGAFVRATGSGAGCGRHWPLCNGEAVPRAPSAETMIEYTHRLTSGLALAAVIVLAVWTFRRLGPGHVARKAAVVALFSMLGEALLGAGLVLLELVAENDSLTRAGVMGLHLGNTFLLLAALALCAWWSGGAAGPSSSRDRGTTKRLAVGLGGALVAGMTGGVAALSDTLRPAASLAAGLQQDLAPASHLLVRLRVVHPFVAAAAGLYLLHLANHLRRKAKSAPEVRRLANLTSLAVLLQVAVGIVNVALLAPVWIQLVHLLLADLLWIALVLTSAAALAQPAEEDDRSGARREAAEPGPDAPGRVVPSPPAEDGPTPGQPGPRPAFRVERRADHGDVAPTGPGAPRPRRGDSRG